ncbi:MAG: tRNA (guanine-N(7)-)-methyltransferase [Acidobacteriota bacterium]|nr:tRNA (guanine-N(7)-)-methyltransferase [Acidobacteriota bacterium]
MVSPSVIVATSSIEPTPMARAVDLDDLIPGATPWELEIGFGKGRYLLERAASRPQTRFAGIEVASKYFRLVAKRIRRRRLSNVIVLRGEALYLLSAMLPAGFARAVHVYFPDPWPKSRHQKRRLFEADTLDLLLRTLEVGGKLFFATDHLEYGDTVRTLLESHPGIRLRVRERGWEDGPRTNYEAKYVREGRPICRFEIERSATSLAELLHPEGAAKILSAAASRE